MLRGHANCAEHVPLGTVLLAQAEAQGWGGGFLHALGALFLPGRLGHAFAFFAAQQKPAIGF